MKILLILLLTVNVSWSQEKSAFEYTKEIHNKINELSKVQPTSYQSRVFELKADLEKFFSFKKKVCNGEFSAVILSEEPSVSSSSKLSKEEKELCFRELKALQTSFINNLFLARKNYLQWGHDKNLKELNEEREKAILSLNESFGKKSSKIRGR
ncbi:hypothetical protein [Halobacteriovorax sp. HLS]|uniref:hypothetical protein n=1 Tax=Halobacteriovorax sp. HLS TaxID=2234000 RepID=UPI000FD7F08F|nr:hypothetical protein [Halobacteriovorax sp. HLS]